MSWEVLDEKGIRFNSPDGSRQGVFVVGSKIHSGDVAAGLLTANNIDKLVMNGRIKPVGAEKKQPKEENKKQPTEVNK